MHFSLETVDLFESCVADGKRGVEEEQLVGRSVSNLQPGMVLNVDFGPSIPGWQRKAALVDLPAGFEEGACSKDDFPTQQLPEGKQESGSDTGQMVTVPLPIVGQSSHINACISRIIDALVNQMPQINLFVDDFAAPLLLFQEDTVVL
jgi:hypothetical protein